MNKAFTITKASEDGDERIIEGIASTPTTDRAGDIVESEGAEYRLPLPLLAQHDPNRPIGEVTEAKVSKTGISFKAKIVKDSGLEYVETMWKQIKLGLVRSVSIGFAPKEYQFMDTGGIRFKIWEWLELSAVTIPANSDALIGSVKALDPAAITAMKSLAASLPGNKAAPSGRSASDILPSLKGTTMTLADRIKAAQGRISALKDQLSEQVERQDDANPNADVGALIEELGKQIASQEKNLEQLIAAEKQMGDTLAAGGRQAPVIEGKAWELKDDSAIAAPSVIRKTQLGTKDGPDDWFFQMAATKALSHIHKQPVESVLDHFYNGKEINQIMKATSAPATTTGSTWAAPLVQQATGAFLDLLTPIAAYPKLAAIGGRMDFGTAGSFKIPFRNDTPGAAGDLRGAFVGEGDPIPVRIASIGSVTFLPKKMATITTFTRELARHSVPQIETLLRKWIVRDTAIAIDTALLDAVAVSTIRPAGLRNGVSNGSGSGLTTIAGVIADLSSLLAQFTLTQEGRSLVWMMNPAQALFLSLLLTSVGTLMFPTVNSQGGTLLGLPVIVSSRVPANTVMLVDGSSFFSATGDTPEFDVSESATIHMDDGAYAANQTATPGTATVSPISTAGTPNVVAAPVRSLWQTASIGLRMILDMDWGLTRSSSVVAVTTAW